MSSPERRVALVTGGARGIGAAIAKRLAADGHDVAILDLDEGACRDTLDEVRAAGGRGLAVGADVSDEASVSAAVDRVAAELGPPLVLVNNAGVLRDGMMHRMSTADWDLVLSVNLRGTFLMCRAVSRYMRTANRGRIVNLSSTAAVGQLGQSNYSAAKAGIQGFTKSLAIELGRHGITVNAVAPGFTVTDMTKELAQRLQIPFEDMEAEAVSGIPVGRTGTPEDIAHAVSFFADERSGFVSGQVLYVAGGPQD